MQFQRNFHSFLLSALIAAIAIVMALTPGHAGAATTSTLYVAPAGSDALACTANSSSKPFATIQKALACTVNGDVVKLAPSGATPYPGIGAITDNVVIEAQPGANARTVTIDLGKGPLSVSPGAALTVSAASLMCVANDCVTSTITNEGALTLIGDTVSGNLSTHSAIVNTTPANSSTPASLTVQNSTISGNAGMFGGGIRSVAGSGATGALTLSIANSTISENFSQTQGGGVGIVQNTVGSSASIVNSTITANTAQNGAGGLYSASPVSLSNTILAANTVRSGTQVDCQASGTQAQIVDGPGGHNLIGNSTGCPQLLSGVDGDQVGTGASPLSPQLAPLAYNGGTTETRPLLAGSPAIAAGSAAVCELRPVLNADQRASSRNTQARDVCDIGAYDTAGATPPATAPAIGSASSASATVSSPFTFKLTATGAPTPALSESGALPVGVSLVDNGDGTASLSGTPAPGSEGSYAITINASNGVGSDAHRSFTLSVAPLLVTAIAPSTITAGAESRSVSVTGSGFEPGAKLASANAGVTFTSVKVKSPTKITAKESVAAGAPIGAFDLTVSVRGVSATCPECLTVAAPPAPSSSSPSTLAQGASGIPVTIAGASLQSVAKVTFAGPGGGVGATVRSATATSLSIRATVASTASPGAYTVILTTRDGVSTSCGGCLTVVATPTVA
jgi:hypothetical protein